jgi:hypothetical protein
MAGKATISVIFMVLLPVNYFVLYACFFFLQRPMQFEKKIGATIMVVLIGLTKLSKSSDF